MPLRIAHFVDAFVSLYDFITHIQHTLYRFHSILLPLDEAVVSQKKNVNKTMNNIDTRCAQACASARRRYTFLSIERNFSFYYFSFTTSWICAICDGSHRHKFSLSAIIRHHLYNEFIFTFTSCTRFHNIFLRKLFQNVPSKFFTFQKQPKMKRERRGKSSLFAHLFMCILHSRLFAMCLVLLLAHKSINSTWFGHWNSIANRIHYGQSCCRVLFQSSSRLRSCCSVASHSF